MHLIDLLDGSVRNYPHRYALKGAGGDLTYEQLGAATNRVARAFIDAGFDHGSRFAVLSPNDSRAFVALMGGLRAGGAWCNINLRNAVDANTAILGDGQCEVLFYHSMVSEQIPRIKEGAPSLKLLICIDQPDAHGPALDDWIAAHDDGFLDRVVPTGALGFQGSTGGTTGRSKLTQADNSWLYMTVLAWATCWKFDAPPVNLAIAPITHAGGIIAMAQFNFGGTTIMMAAPDITKMLELIQNERVTTLFLPPTVIYLLLAHPQLGSFDTSSLKYVVSAAAPIAPEKVVEGIEKLGPVMCQAFGQTEAGFPLTWIAPEEWAEAARDETKRHRLSSCGRQVLTARIEVIDVDGKLLGPNELGEIVVRGPTTMQAYLNDPKATAEIQAHGWHHTGDIGYRDEDGYLYINDRKRDLIISGGFNVFPFEVEQVILQHPAVQDVAVIGVPHEKWGEAVHAVVQVKKGAELDVEALIALCKDKLGSVKAPKSVDIWDDLPRSAPGKILKREIRKKYGPEKPV